MKKNIRCEKGFTALDVGLAMFAIIIFIVIITSISYSVFLSSMEAKKTAIALNYGVDIFEHIGEIDYEDVCAESREIFNTEALTEFVQESVTTNNEIQTITGRIGAYSIELTIEDYNQENLIKIISLRISFLVSKEKTESVELQRLKIMETDKWRNSI